jgi:hypothetical protein
MKTQIITITPKIAEKLLKKNIGNRPMNKGNLKYWERQLAEGSAILSHQGIAISGSVTRPKRLLDGQHRLQAIVNTGVSFRVLLFTGCVEDTFKVLDSGRSRTLSDRTALNALEISMANFFWRMYGNGSDRSRMGPDEATSIIEVIGDGVAEINHGNGGKNMSKQWVRAAFVMQYMETSKSDYSNFKNGLFEHLSKSLLAVYRKLATDGFTGNQVDDRMGGFWSLSHAISNPKMSRVQQPKLQASIAARMVVAAKCPELHDLMIGYFPNTIAESV